MYRTKFLLIAFLVVLLAHTGATQINTPIAETYSLQEGLSDRSVRSIIKGRDSLIWIGTANGLNKFDGYNFTVFNSDPDDSLRLLGSNVRQLRRNADDQLIILYENTTWTFNIFDPLTYELRKVELSPTTGVKGLIRAIEVDEEGEIFVLTFSESEDSTRVFQFDGQKAFQPVFALYQPHKVQLNYQVVFRHLSSGDFLINDSALGLQLLTADGQIKKYFQDTDFTKPDNQSTALYPNRINILHEDKFGQIWVAWENVPGIFYLKYEDLKFERKTEFNQDGYYSEIWEDAPGNLLLLETNPAGSSEVINVYAYTPRGQLFNFSHLLEGSKNITSLFSEDFFKTIFLGTNDGFKVVRNNRFRIKNYLTQESEEINDNVVLKGIVGDDNNYVYLAAESRHWYRLDLTTDLLDTLSFRDTRTGRSLSLNCGVNLMKDADGFIWGASCETRQKNKLYKYDPELCTVEDFDIPYPIRAFTIAENGLFWLGCSPSESTGILLIFDPDTGDYQEFFLRDGSNPLQSAIPNYLFQSKDGLIWAGTGNGVFAFNTEAKSYTRYHTDAETPEHQISHNYCLLVYEDERGNIMLGTQNGLNIIDRNQDQIKVLRRRDGLTNNTVTGILPDGNGNFWISTNNGISFYDPKDDTFKNYFQADGFSANAFNPFSFYRDENGRYYFGSVNGLNVFLPRDLLLHEPKPKVLLTKIERYRSRDDSRLVLESNLHQIDQLVIEPYDTYVNLHFTFPEFSRPGKNQYRMKLEENQAWSNLYNDPIIRINYPAGNYTLMVEGADANGNWSAEPFILPIRIKKPFYEKTWVIVLFILIIFSLIYGVFQSRMRQRLKMEQLRTKLASDLHDEVSGLLSGIAMQSDLVQFMVTDTKIQTRLKTIGEVSRKAMSKMSDVIWSIDSRKDQLEDLIGRMHEHADEMLLPLNIRYDIQVSHKLERGQKIPANIRQDLYFIYKEAINNIAKHSNADRVFINMRQSGNYFELSVQDNGTPVPKLAPAHVHEAEGSDKSALPTPQTIPPPGGFKKKSGQGLSNLKMRAERLKADLDINRKNGYAILLRMKKFM